MKATKIFLAILATLISPILHVHCQSVLTNGLVAYYPYAGNPNDASGNGYNGTNSGATLTTDRFNNPNSAYYFNGTNSAIYLPTPAFNNLAQGTISTWVELVTNTQASIFAKQHDGVNTYGSITVGYYLGLYGSPIGTGPAGELYFHSQNGVANATSAPLLSTGVWHQIVVTFSSTNCSAYIDGTISGSTSGNYSIPNDSSPTLIAIGYLEGLPTLAGKLDDFRVYNVALSATNVAQLYSIESGQTVTITSQPQTVTVNSGSKASFSVTAFGSLPLSYQWELNTTNISGATNASLILPNVTTNSAGLYTVIVGSAAGYISSSNAVLTVIPPPTAATAVATLYSDFVVSAAITGAGFGYTNTPTVRFIGGGGSGAGAYVTISNGLVVSITVTNAGYGYTNAPLVVIDPPVIPNPVLGITPMSLLSFSNLTSGDTYQLQRFTANYWTNQPLNFTATNVLYEQIFPGVVGGGEYRLALSPVPTQALATLQVVDGFVVSATLTSGGSGYLTSPIVTIVGPPGANAAAVAVVSGGVVTGITITNAGSGYTSTAAIEIAPPPTTVVNPTVLPAVQLNASNLAPYDNYQIQFTPTLGTAWQNWNGGFFTTTGATISQDLVITNVPSFFRLQYVP